MKKIFITAGAFLITAPAFSFQDLFISNNLQKSEITVGFYSGELQGINSDILRPDYFLKINITKIYKTYEIYSQITGLYGDALIGDGKGGTKKVSNQPLELDFKGHILKIFKENKNFRFSAGVFGEIFYPLKDFEPFITKIKDQYGAGEDKIPTDKKYTIGLGVQWDGVYDKFSSTLNIIYYPYGTKVAANLAPYAPLMSFNMYNKIYFFGTFDNPKFNLFLNSEFYFQKKYDGASVFSIHDGLAGTKREFDVELGIEFFIKRRIHIYFTSYGNNNLNRGWSRTKPNAYKDGYYAGLGSIF